MSIPGSHKGPVRSASDPRLNYGKRIDARNQNDPAVQAGMRNIHRDMKGNVIGGTTAEGAKIGTAASPFRRNDPAPSVAVIAASPTTSPFRKPAVDNLTPKTPGLDSMKTPGLDALDAMNPGAPRGDAAIAASANRGGKTAPATGGLLDQRRKLATEMQSGGRDFAQSPQMQGKARALGVTPQDAARVAATVAQAPAAIAAVPTPGPSTPLARPAQPPSTPVAPQSLVSNGAPVNPKARPFGRR